jgi:hypothetical protein
MPRIHEWTRSWLFAVGYWQRSASEGFSESYQLAPSDVEVGCFAAVANHAYPASPQPATTKLRREQYTRILFIEKLYRSTLFDWKKLEEPSVTYNLQIVSTPYVKL